MVTQTPELTRLMSNARIHLPGALDDALKLELFNVLDDFCQRSKFWQEDIDYAVVTTRTSYELIGSEEGQIIELMNNVNSDDIQVAATMSTIGTIDLDNDPAEADTYTATVAYTVVDPVGSDDYPRLPDNLLYKYGSGIMHGLVAAMMLHPAKPYTNQQLAVYHSKKLSAAIANARADVLHQNIYDGQRWRFPSFASGSQR